MLPQISIVFKESTNGEALPASVKSLVSRSIPAHLTSYELYCTWEIWYVLVKNTSFQITAEGNISL